LPLAPFDRLRRATFLLQALLIFTCLAASSHAAPPPLRIAFIDPMSGPFANAGESTLRHARAAFEQPEVKRAMNGTAVEVVPFDNRASAQETLNQLQLAIDRGFRYVMQGQSSAAALALIDAIDKHNQRNPGREVLFLNYAALDPALTNERCSYWHFRFDADVNMRMEALVAVIARDPKLKSVYLIGQDYSFGRAVHQAARAALARRRPDVTIAGEDLHPIGAVKDFAPYAAKIKASGANAVITGNWGNDLTLLVRAARESSLNADFYTFYAGSLGAVTAIGPAGAGRLKQVNEWHANQDPPGHPNRLLAAAYKQRNGEDFYFMRVFVMARMFAQAYARAGAGNADVSPGRLAAALEGLHIDGPTGAAEMRAADHQLIEPLVVSTLWPIAARGGPKEVSADVEGTGLGFKTDAKVEGYVTALPTTCRMQRPPG
jgi:branched-chain amino acid transport system substrate-binding protein